MRSVKAWVAQTTGGLPRAYWFLWTNMLINRIGAFVMILLALYLTQERHLTASFAGFVIGLWGAGGAVGTLAGGVLADRIGRRRTLLGSLYGAAAMMVLLGFARGKLEIALAVLALGMINEANRPAQSALMIDVVPEQDRVRAFSLQYWVINLGFAFAALTAGLVAGIDFRLVFAIDAATTVIGATIIAFTVPEPPRRDPPTVAPSPRASAGPVAVAGNAAVAGKAAVAARPAGLIDVFRDRVFLGFVGVNLLVSLVFMQHISMLPITMAQDGLSPRTFGAVIAVNGVLIVAGQLFMGRLLGRMRRATAMALAALIMGAGFGLTAFANSAWAYAVTVLVWTVGEMLNAPSNAATTADLSPAALRGRYQGVYSLSWSVASFAAPVIGGAVLEHFGSTRLWLGCFALGVVAAVLNLRAGPARDRRTAELRSAALRTAELRTAELQTTALHTPTHHTAGDLRTAEHRTAALHTSTHHTTGELPTADLVTS